MYINSSLCLGQCRSKLHRGEYRRRYHRVHLPEPEIHAYPVGSTGAHKAYCRRRYQPEAVVTHDLKAALRSARTVLHIGRSSVFLGTVADYLASPQGRRFREAES